METLILGINGSPRKSATYNAVKHALEAAKSVPGTRVELIDLTNKKIHGCTGCDACNKKGVRKCLVFEDDFIDEYFDLYSACDGIILASPIYMMNSSGLLTNFISRMRPIKAIARSGAYAARMGGAIAVGGQRNGGQDVVTAALNHMIQTSGANIVGGNIHFYNGATVWSKNEKDFDDPKGLLELEILGRKVAYMAKVVKAGLNALGGDVTMLNCAGFLDENNLKESYKKIGIDF